MTFHSIGGGLAIICAAAALGADGPTPSVHYAIVDRISAPDTPIWDHVLVDRAARRFYLAAHGVMAVDLQTRTVTSSFVPGELTHGLAQLNDGSIAVADGTQHAVIVFDGATGRTISRVSTDIAGATAGWHNPDALLVEPATGLLVAANGDSGVLILIDPATYSVVGKIPVGGQLEAADVDGQGRIYINVRSSNSVAVVDVARRTLVKSFALKNCDEPAGLSYDRDDGLVMTVCRNGLIKFILAKDGSEAASISVGKGVDDVTFDPARHVAFCPSAADGMLSVIAVQSAKRIFVAQRLATQPLARLGALDSVTGRLYLPAATPDPSATPVSLPGIPPLPGIVPGSFAFLVVAPD
jgi:DNA-binding beta-propeller fold protein YncE